MSDELTPDKAFKEMQKALRGYVKKWVPKLGLDAWHIDMNWIWGNKKGQPASHAIGAETATAWPYLRARVDFYLTDLTYYGPDELEEVVVHELCHVITAEGFEGGGECTDNQERVVTNLARAFLRVDRSQ